jgi:hypothetical protein
VATFPPIVPPPRPPEVPDVPVPPVRPTTTADQVFPQGRPPPLQKWVEGADTFVRERSLQLDAFIARWVEEFIRVLKEAWDKLKFAFEELDKRITALEQRVADTYTFGQKGKLKKRPDPDPNWIALPLRVVRDEVLLEVVATVETPSSDGDVNLSVQHEGDEIVVLTLASGEDFTVNTFDPPRDLAYNDKLLVQLRDAGTDAADVVVQIRCR